MWGCCTSPAATVKVGRCQLLGRLLVVLVTQMVLTWRKKHLIIPHDGWTWLFYHLARIQMQHYHIAPHVREEQPLLQFWDLESSDKLFDSTPWGPSGACNLFLAVGLLDLALCHHRLCGLQR